MKKTKHIKKMISILLFCFLLSSIRLNVYADTINSNVSTNMFIYNDLQFKYEYDALWLKVFYHNSSNGEFFSTLDETINCNTPNKYSILCRLDEFKTKDTYEFLLEYPEISGYNRWTQTSNPITTLERVDGYNPIDISWDGNWWNGLCLSNGEGSFIEGTVGHQNWFYAIGCRRSWNEENHIPSSGIPVTQVYLWLRVDGNYNLYDEFEKSVKDNNVFAKVFSQNTREEVYFQNQEEAYNVSNCYNYSILNQLDRFYINEKYEFYLEYPEISGFNRWSQTTNPVEKIEYVENYTPISISWNGAYWNGLAFSNSGASFLDGGVNHNTWWYSIACYKDKWNRTTNDGYTGFPGPHDGTTKYTVSLCNLYARGTMV